MGKQPGAQICTPIIRAVVLSRGSIGVKSEHIYDRLYRHVPVSPPTSMTVTNDRRSQLQAWSRYHDRVTAVINDVEKTDWVQQAIDASHAVEAAEKEKAAEFEGYDQYSREHPAVTPLHPT